jgi:hypothetical protein
MASLVAGALVGSISIGQGSWIAFAVAIGAISCVWLLIAHRLLGSYMTAGALTALACLFWFVARPVYIAGTGVTNLGASVDARSIDAGDGRLASALQVVTIFVVAAFVAWLAVAGGLLRKRRHTDLPVDQTLSLRSIERMIVALTVVVWVVLVVLVQGSGSFATYLADLSVRSTGLQGRVYLTLAYVPLTVALCLRILAGPADWRFLRTPSFVVGLTSALLFGVATGGRAAVLLGVALPVLIAMDRRVRTFSFVRFVSLAVAGVVLLVALAVLLRDTQFEGSARSDPLGAVVGAVSNLGDSTLGSLEARPFDSVLAITEAAESQRLERQDGKTYGTVLAWFVPRAFWPEKPYGNGNAAFTAKFVPRFYGTNRIETSVSLPGEAIFNFGYAGLFLSGLIFGSVVGAIDGLLSSRRGTFGTLLGVLLTPVCISLLRGDAYHNVPLFVVWPLAAGGVWVLSRSSTIEPVGHRSLRPQTPLSGRRRNTATTVLRS